MQTLPSLKRWLAAGLTAAIFVVVVIAYSLSGRQGLIKTPAHPAMGVGGRS